MVQKRKGVTLRKAGLQREGFSLLPAVYPAVAHSRTEVHFHTYVLSIFLGPSWGFSRDPGPGVLPSAKP